MRLLFDQNLSRSLVPRLVDVFPGAAHVVHLGLEHADDAALWAAARHDGYALVTKDTDFHDESRFPGPPPKVLHVALGNGPTSSVEAALRNSQVSILRFSSDDRRLMVLR